MTLRELIAAYLAEQADYLREQEMYYLLEGVGWAIRRIRGVAPVDANYYEPEPTETLDQFLRRHDIRGENE